ncbi:transcription factor bHLH167-like [Dioscorea cayenensis subsp. rotundata]|uniref:Transcription factor bHLH167-like n=1 Tax=Dioscorea cayennensis subsp. rotundata TaxID=55577 RepID=A0AB40ANJ5_DIOCR|nr:transcription factor bHLH167-like [Dioscorea cayenensis subsp. rotundata]
MVPLMKVERKVLEKKRRIQMKALCLELNSLIPNENKDSSSSKSSSSQLHLLDQAAKYIKELRERVDTLKEMKKIKINNNNNNNNVNSNDDEEMPVIQVKKVDSNLEVVLVSKLNKQVMFHEVIRVLGEEGAEINNASFSIVGDKIFHTIHSQVNCSGMDFNCPAMLERLQELVHRRDALCSRKMQE